MVIDLELPGPPLVRLAELPDGTDLDRLDVLGEVIPPDHHPLATTDRQAARPLALGVIDVLERQETGRGNVRLIAEPVAGMVLDGQVEAPESELDRPTVDDGDRVMAVS